MHFKYPIIILLCFALSLSAAEIVQFNTSNNGTNRITIPAGEKWKVISYSAQWDATVFAGTNQTTAVGLLKATTSALYGGDSSTVGSVGVSLVGPVNIKPENGTYYIAFEKSSVVASETSLSSTAVVIPSSATGDVDVKMEQSADNVTWTECLPGTYNSSTVKRFFRLRAIEK